MSKNIIHIPINLRLLPDELKYVAMLDLEDDEKAIKLARLFWKGLIVRDNDEQMPAQDYVAKRLLEELRKMQRNISPLLRLAGTADGQTI